MSSGKYRNLISDTTVFAVGNLGSKIISFFLVPLYTNYLTTAEFGTADYVISCANLIVPIASLVIQDAVLRFGLSKDCDKQIVLKNATLVFAFGCIISFLSLFLFAPSSILYEWKYYLFAISVSNMAWNIMSSYSKACDKNKQFAFAGMLYTFILAIVNILLLVVWPIGVKGYLTANILATIIPIIFLMISTDAFSSVLNSKYDKKLLKTMLNYSLPLIANNLSWWILNSSDKFMIEIFCDSSQLGLYAAAGKIPALISIVNTIFSQAWSISAIKEIEGEGEKQFYSNVFSAFSFVVFFFACCVLFVLKFFMKLYVGPDFYNSWVYVPMLIVGTVYFAFGSFFGAIYGAFKKNVSVTITTLIAAVINASINLALMPAYGVLIAAFSTAVSFFYVGTARMLGSRKFFKFEIDFKRFVINSVLLIVQAILITLNHAGYLVNSLFIVAFVIVNLKSLRQVALVLKGKKHE